jgi:signal transduction histidine kinase
MPFLNTGVTRKIWLSFNNFRLTIEQRVENFGAAYIAFGIFGILNYPIFYLIWIYYNTHGYESFALRATATILSAILLLKNYWPKILRPWLPVYWYLTLMFCLPFFFFFMLFKNDGASVWLMSSNTILFWLILMVDWASYFGIFLTGFLLACFLYVLTTPGFILNLAEWWGVAAQFVASFIVVAFFAHSKQEFDQKKLKAMSTLAASIAHELRTPLTTLYACAGNLQQYFPKLIGAYKLAEQFNLPIQKLRPSQFALLEEIPLLMENETKASSTFIDMLLMNANAKTNEGKTEIFSVINCVNEALSRYPFTPNQRDMVRWNSDIDFNIKGHKLLVIHILFNLLKNAIFYTAKAGKGEIRIWAEQSISQNFLYFEDTGTGISMKNLRYIFDRFFSTTHHGAGIGLTFCKMAMEAIGGRIYCESVEGSYTKFILSFPNEYER